VGLGAPTRRGAVLFPAALQPDDQSLTEYSRLWRSYVTHQTM
jgi:hypothetical protein